MVVHHGGDAVVAVAIKLVLVHPPARIGHQEAQRLPVACFQQDSRSVKDQIVALSDPVHAAVGIGQQDPQHLPVTSSLVRSTCAPTN